MCLFQGGYREFCEINRGSCLKINAYFNLCNKFEMTKVYVFQVSFFFLGLTFIGIRKY